MQEKLSADQILNNIFDIMQELYNEMSSNKKHRGDHFHVFNMFAELGRTLAGADRASFWRWDKHAHKLITNAATGTDRIVINDSTGLVGRALAENRPIVANDPYHHPDFNAEVDKKTGYVTKSILVMPVSNCRGEVIGAFQVINKLGTDAGFDEVEDSKRLAIAAFICGMALESELFLADSQHDRLTSLKNRFGFYGDCQTRYQKIFDAEQSEKFSSLIICDIDFFKRVNDTFGHNAGDAVLKSVAGILHGNILESDCVYRWGGEEFVIILDGADLNDAAAVAENIRSAVEHSVCRFDSKDIRVTMSLGCVEIDPTISVDDNIKIADARLYRAKAGGRNKIVLSG